jgi:hypothetical protein
MKWKSRSREIIRLQEKYKGVKYRVAFPDLSVERRGPPTGNYFGPISGKRTIPVGAKAYPVGHSHKQGIELLTPNMLKNELQYLGGKKT